MRTVYINPSLPVTAPHDGGGGILRVVEAMVRHLPEFGYTVVNDPKEADIINNHGAMLHTEVDVPMVSSCHGMYWSDYEWNGEYHDVNRHVVECLAQSNAITAPSEWVRNAITRGMLRNPTVVYHGIDLYEWPKSEPVEYVLWNKARIDPVADNMPLMQIAELMPEQVFVTTYGKPTANVHVTGPLSYETMKHVIAGASIYLATTRETFGIGTLEAMACGVPVVGWDFGGQHEIIKQNETGALVPVGDYEQLMAAIRYVMKYRERFSEACRDDILRRWQWQGKIAMYAEVFDKVLQSYNAHSYKTSIIVTCHNLARFLSDALRSVANQTNSNVECIVIDDASTDETRTVYDLFVGKSIDLHKRFRYVRLDENVGLSAARNEGLKYAQGRYILHLDADDILPPNAVDLLSLALDRDASIHIAYGALNTVNEDAENEQRNSWPFDSFNWYHQISHLNQLPYAAMMRREVLESVGGYRLRDWRAEDASLWTRATSFGFRARKVTDECCLIYRMRQGSKSGREREAGHDDGNWCALFPWTLASNSEQGMAIAPDAKEHINPKIVPWSAQGTPPARVRFWPVPHHAEPVVSVIVPCIDNHRSVLIDALDSLQAQTFTQWECIVINDSATTLDLPAHPWARIINTPHRREDENEDKGYVPVGAGAARNIGIDSARGQYVLFLDADDMLVPNALEDMARAVVGSDGAYAYSDWSVWYKNEKWDDAHEIQMVPEYTAFAQFVAGQHPVTALVERGWAADVRFDESLPFLEDWQFFADCATKGYCGVRVGAALLVYRFYSSVRRALSGVRRDENGEIILPEQTQLVIDSIRARYSEYIDGNKTMAGCCGGNKAAVSALSAALGANAPDVLIRAVRENLENEEEGTKGIAAPTMVAMEFVGEQYGATTWLSKDRHRQYIGGLEPNHRYCEVWQDDVEHLENTGVWRRVRRT